SLTIIRNTVPPEVEAILVKALAKVPADRYATAAEFADALRHPETQRSLIAARPAPWKLAALGVGLAAVLGAGGYAAWRSLHGSGQPPAALGGPDPRHVAVL